jgi:hypothetical protein
MCYACRACYCCCQNCCRKCCACLCMLCCRCRLPPPRPTLRQWQQQQTQSQAREASWQQQQVRPGATLWWMCNHSQWLAHSGASRSIPCSRLHVYPGCCTSAARCVLHIAFCSSVSARHMLYAQSPSTHKLCCCYCIVCIPQPTVQPAAPCSTASFLRCCWILWWTMCTLPTDASCQTTQYLTSKSAAAALHNPAPPPPTPRQPAVQPVVHHSMASSLRCCWSRWWTMCGR